MEKSLLRVGEAAEFLAVSRWTIYRWVEEGRLEGTKIGHGSLRIFRASITKLVEQSRTEDVREDTLPLPQLALPHKSAHQRVATH